MKVEIKEIDSKKLYGVTVASNKSKNRKLLVPKTLPHEIVEIEITRVGKKTTGRAIQFYKTSSERIKPKCSHYQFCGGCSLQHLSYDKQWKLKQKKMKEVFDFEINGIKSEIQFHYRNRMDFIAKKGNSNEILLGLREIGRYDSFVNIKKCELMNSESARAFKAISDRIKDLDVSVYDFKKRIGCLRYVVVQGTDKMNLISLLVSEDCNKSEIEKLKTLSDCNKIDKIILNYTDSLSDISQDEKFEVIKGNTFLEQTFLGYSFKYPFNGFFQRNPVGFELLVKKIREIIKKEVNNPSERVLLDLFSGVGLFSISLADLFKEVKGFELNTKMVKAAEENSLINKVDAKFSAVDLYKEEIEISPRDVVVFDPPRAGLGKKMIKSMLKNKPEFIIYVSCNPQSQKSDFDLLKQEYNVKEAFWVDMFPQTAHIESVLILNRRNA